MKFTKAIIKKANHLRKKNWSAPTIMSVFIIICMMIIFSFETLGLANKEKNLDYRHTTPEKSKQLLNIGIKTVSEHISETGSSNYEISNEIITNKLIDKLKFLTERSKEETMEKMLKILNEGAKYQNDYNSLLNIPLEENREFYDL